MSDADDAPLASEKQLKFIQVLTKKVGLSDEDFLTLLDDLSGKEALEDLTRREASELIDELHVQARDKGIDLDAQPRASDKQIGFMKSLKRRAHLTDDEFAALLEERAGVTDPDEVGKRDASAIIDELIQRADAIKSGAGSPAAKKPKKPAPEASDPSGGPPPPPPPPEGGYDDDPPF